MHYPFYVSWAYRVCRRMVAAALGRRPLLVPHFGANTLDQDDVELAKSWLGRRGEWYGRNEVLEFEERFAEWNGSKYACSFMAGRVALSACIQALGLRPGDEVIVPGYTCAVVPNAFHFADIATKYCDIELETFGPDVSSVERHITSRTKAILIQHLYGLVCRDYQCLVALARRRGLFIIEDCAQSTGASYHGTNVGNLGDVAIYSLEQSKVLTTGQGGIATANETRLGRRLRTYQKTAPPPDERRLGKLLHAVVAYYYRYKHPTRWWRSELVSRRYQHSMLRSTSEDEVAGTKPTHYGQSMPAPIASLATNQLGKVDRYNRRRQAAVGRWDAWASAAGYARPTVLEDTVPVWLRYPVLVELGRKRDTRWALRELRVAAGVWFVSQLHPRPGIFGDCPKAMRAVAQCINLPTLP